MLVTVNTSREHPRTTCQSDNHHYRAWIISTDFFMEGFQAQQGREKLLRRRNDKNDANNKQQVTAQARKAPSNAFARDTHVGLLDGSSGCTRSHITTGLVHPETRQRDLSSHKEEHGQKEVLSSTGEKSGRKEVLKTAFARRLHELAAEMVVDARPGLGEDDLRWKTTQLSNQVGLRRRNINEEAACKQRTMDNWAIYQRVADLLVRVQSIVSKSREKMAKGNLDIRITKLEVERGRAGFVKSKQPGTIVLEQKFTDDVKSKISKLGSQKNLSKEKSTKENCGSYPASLRTSADGVQKKGESSTSFGKRVSQKTLRLSTGAPERSARKVELECRDQTRTKATFSSITHISYFV